MRILFIVEHFPSFSETFVLNQVTGLLDLGHDVTVYAVGKPSGAVIHPDFEKYKLLERTWAGSEVPVSKVKRFFGALRYLPRLFGKCGLRAFSSFDPLRHGKKAINLGFFYSCLPLLGRETRFDAIHCHFGDKGVRVLCWQKMGLVQGPITTVFHAHELSGLSELDGRRIYGSLFKSRALLLPVSEHWRQRLIGWGSDPSRVIVHHMGVDVGRFEYHPNPPKPDDPIRILTVARLVEQKGYEYAIRAIAHLKNTTGRSLQYTIIGAGDNAGDLRVSLENLAVELAIRDLVVFAGPQPQDVVKEHMRVAHVFLHPSVTTPNGFQEGIPVALMEAMASGVPVVSTRHSGIPELIEHAVSGYLAEERQVEPLADAMAELIINCDIYQRCAEQGRAKIEREFNIETLNRQLSNILSGKFNHTD